MAAGVRAGWPAGPAGWVLLALIVVGLVLRVIASIASWPTFSTLEDQYQVYARIGPFLDPQHPAGYALVVGAVGAVSRDVAALVCLQHLLSLASALLMFGAVRRVGGSQWAGLLPAAMILLGADQIFLEHVVMSESWEVLMISAGLYATVRAIDAPSPWWRWPVLSGAVFAGAVMIRTAAVPLIAVAVLAVLVLARRRVMGGGRLLQWRPALAVAVAAVVPLLVFAGANARWGQRFGIAPSPGWHLYGMVAQFGDCKQFTPPRGTRFLCESRPASERPGAYYYMYAPQAPAPRRFGQIGTKDRVLGGWARRALFAQFGDFLGTAWTYLRTYFVPGSLPARLRSTNGSLDPQVDFTFTNPFYRDAIKRSLESFYAPFAVHTRSWALKFMHDWQRVFRFGATALFITMLLTLVGLVVGTALSRTSVFLFGVGGLSLLIAPALGGTYSGRYTVPMAAPLMAASAIAIRECWVAARGARGHSRGGARVPAGAAGA